MRLLSIQSMVALSAIPFAGSSPLGPPPVEGSLGQVREGANGASDIPSHTAVTTTVAPESNLPSGVIDTPSGLVATWPWDPASTVNPLGDGVDRRTDDNEGRTLDLPSGHSSRGEFPPDWLGPKPEHKVHCQLIGGEMTLLICFDENGNIVPVPDGPDSKKDSDLQSGLQSQQSGLQSRGEWQYPDTQPSVHCRQPYKNGPTICWDEHGNPVDEQGHPINPVSDWHPPPALPSPAFPPPDESCDMIGGEMTDCH